MILKRFYDEKLAQASYLVGCPGAGAAIVIDPNRNFQQYIDEAAKDGMKITAVTETHIHADYLSGSLELAERTGATLYVSDEGDADWKYSIPTQFHRLKDGDVIQAGAVKLEVIHTPGHTPEHISFLLTDAATSPEPLGIFSGDFVFVGDVGRPDLLEQAAGVSGTQEPGARDLFQSIKKLADLPDHLLIWPGHGAGSACGKSLGGVPVSSLGYERRTNWAFKATSEDAFVREVLSGQPEPPTYFAEMKRMNKLGPALLPVRDRLPRIADSSVLTNSEVVVLDVRPSAEYLSKHIKGSLHAPLAQSFTTWAGWYVPYRTDIVILAKNGEDAEDAVKNLAMIGLDQVIGWADESLLNDVAGSGVSVASITSLPSDEVDLANGVLLDVRSQNEWEEGHIDGAIHIPMGFLARRRDQIPGDKTIYVHCRGGVRSPVAAAMVERLGFGPVINVSDGYLGLVEWSKTVVHS
ncbi:MBL fold metallo-hydrolase [Kamptonema cortianum]|nr:MBL fold metallo-hydrolase [Geitlerinema splendidum]MDK3160919.1 MBL fold metallo-hydrolase [Kamptonema cortianum]